MALVLSLLIDQETMETMVDFIFLCSKITADGDCRHEIKRCLLLGRKAMTNLDNILKCRDNIGQKSLQYCKVISLQLIKKNKMQRHYFVNKRPSRTGLIFPIVMYRCKSWTIKKAEHWRFDVYELWHWRRFLRIPWTARRSTSPS